MVINLLDIGLDEKKEKKFDNSIGVVEGFVVELKGLIKVNIIFEEIKLQQKSFISKNFNLGEVQHIAKTFGIP